MKTALILDDQSEYIRALARSLRDVLDVVGVETQIAAHAALTPAMTVALVDICLSASNASNRDGLEFIRWLHAERPDIKIIAMSARDDHDLPQEAVVAGALQFLSKPLKMSELKTVLSDFGTREGP